jgi:uncharacterized protein
MEKLDFYPFFGISSKHLQTILPLFRSPGCEPPWKYKLVELGDHDRLACKVSVPTTWKPTERTIVLVHGLGGSDSSGYMIRLSRKCYENNYKVYRVNLRACGEWKGLSKLPSYAGASADLLHVLQACKKESPESEITLIGYSLGGNIALKLAGELGDMTSRYLAHLIAISPPLDLSDSIRLIMQKKHALYHSYYLKNFSAQVRPWLLASPRSIYEIDQTVIAPHWGYQSAEEYYLKCSSKAFLPAIQIKSDVLLSEDDPFIDLSALQGIVLSRQVKVWITNTGGHMGYIGKTRPEYHSYWLDQQLLKWIAKK